ncbi:hypothetical protein [Bradyrhizobium sp. AZCC 2289]|uniref:hypothetical protein n=1 Tax=Bradyrhizobium sp. AZCC 2289 TaxID=3117026 RepID=UPI002FF0AF9B
MDTKTENAIAPLVKLWQQREAQFEQRIIEWACGNLSPDQSNALIQMVRDLQSSIDVHNELATFAAILTQPATTN